MKPEIKRIIFIGLLAMTIVIGILHYITPGYMILYHDTYRRITYFPITIAAILFGLPGGILIASLSCLAFVPHLFMFWYQGPDAYYSELSEIVFYLLAGVVVGLISSNQNRLKEKYRQLSEKLAFSFQRLHDQAEQLVAAEKQLARSEQLSLLGHVSASLAHEIKNPLASIKGAAEILADEVPDGHEKHEFIEIMRSEISRLNNSVEEVLQYCRGQAENGTKKLVQVNQIIQRVVLLLEKQVQEKAIHIRIDSRSQNFDCMVDEAPFIQVLMNIILNSIEAVEKNGIITIECFVKENGCIVEITDDGPGIDPALEKDIFKSFVTSKEQGTGLGLSISKKIMNSMGGTICAGSSDKGGAKFKLLLPLKKSEAKDARKV
ncbi:MAG: hypothetical protein GY729_10840 [Desulfobacteraceae bacterium]|nr:hypothetical protein [Desulfobacteraceae bacterium]